MSLAIAGNYILRLIIAGMDVPLSPSTIGEFVISHDIDRFLPEFKIVFMDTMGLLTHVAVTDQSMADVRVMIGSESYMDSYNAYKFKVLRRKPVSLFGVTAQYDIEGVLNCPKLNSPRYTRARSQSIKQFLTDMAVGELGVRSGGQVDIDANLINVKKILQPDWSNAQLLNWLKDNLSGDFGDSAFKCFLRVREGEREFVFKSLESLYSAEARHKFIVGNASYQDYEAAYEYRLFDNANLLGTTQQKIGFFNYDTSSWEEKSHHIDDFYSLTEYFLVDSNDPVTGRITKAGTTNEFTNDFSGKAKSIFYDRLNNLLCLWITTRGLCNVCPGDIAEVIFAQELELSKFVSFQYSGQWMVKRIVHAFRDTYMSRILLVRSGVNTEDNTTLARAIRKKAIKKERQQ
jgi:hypothetical protein